jgi:hypothetical protein
VARPPNLSSTMRKRVHRPTGAATAEDLRRLWGHAPLGEVLDEVAATVTAVLKWVVWAWWAWALALLAVLLRPLFF